MNEKMKQGCKTCIKFQQPAPRKWRRCTEGILPCRQSHKDGERCLWWDGGVT